MEVRFLKRQGLNITQIANRLGLDRKTVRKHLKEDASDNRLVKRNCILDAYKPYLDHRLNAWPELSAARLFREISNISPAGTESRDLVPVKPFEGSERSVRRYISGIRPRKERYFRPIETLPGEQAQVDWGYFGYIETEGVKKRLYGFSFVLSYSRIRYVEFTTSQDIVTFLGCLLRALQYVGGVVEHILFDNAKTVVIERVGSVVQFNRDLWRFAAQYGFRPEACWVRDPESKGKVENSIKYVKRDFFYGSNWADLDSLNIQARAWCDEVANEKVHETTLEVPADRLAEEKKALSPLPVQSVPLFEQVTRRARKDGTFCFETNNYSVPHPYARREIIVQAHRDHLEVFCGQEHVCSHERCHERGQLVLQESHYEDRPYGRRNRKDALQSEFEGLGPAAAAYLKGLARSRQGRLREQARQILDLAKEHGSQPVHQAMVRAAEFERYGYPVIKRIVEKRIKHPDALPDLGDLLGTQGRYSGPAIQVQERSLAEYDRLLEVLTT